jgi:hypothetical protein
MEWSWCVLIFKALRTMDISAEVFKSVLQGDLFNFTIRNEWSSLTFT